MFIRRVFRGADQKLSRKIVSEDLRKSIAKFAADAVTRKDGEKWFAEYLGTLVPALRDKPTGDGIASMSVSVDASNPMVEKFAKDSPEAAEQVGAFSAQWRQLKAAMGDRMECTEENYVSNELSLWKARRNGTLENASGRS